MPQKLRKKSKQSLAKTPSHKGREVRVSCFFVTFATWRLCENMFS